MQASAFLRTTIVGLVILAFPISAIAGKLYWITDKVKRANLNGTGQEDLYVPGFPVDPLAFTVDPANEKIYFIQNGLGVMRVNFDGTGLENITAPIMIDQTQGGDPRALAFHATGTAGELFVCAENMHTGNKFFRIDLETMQTHLAFILPGASPRNLVIDPSAPSGARMYWLMSGGSFLESAKLDGSDLQYHSIGENFGWSFALNSSEGKLYFHTPVSIRRCNLDLSELEEVVTGLPFDSSSGGGGITIDPAGEKIYWIHAEVGYRADLDGQNVETFMPAPTGGRANLFFNASANKVYYADKWSGRIGRMNPDGTDIEILLANPGDGPQGLALDTATGRRYWSIGGYSIFRAEYDGSNQQQIATLSQFVNSMTVDPVGQKLYWSQEGRDIFRADLDGANIEQIVTNVDAGAYGLAIDSVNSKLYWTPDRLEISPLFSRSNLDGTDIEQFIDIYYAFPLQYMDIALDVPNGKVYMTRNQGILRCNLDATNIEELIPIAPITDTASRLALDLDEQHIYWTNYLGIHRADLNGSNIVTIVPNQEAFGGLALDTTCVTQFYGDVNTSGAVDLDDILCTLRAFSNISICTGADLSPCSGNGLVNLDDILAQLGAFSGNGACPDLCN